jgi:hypothetical protein
MVTVRWGWFVLFWVTLATACGGKVETEQRPDKPAPADSERTDAHAGESFDEDAPLPECVPGFEPGSNPDVGCPWVFDELCYATKLEACACACTKAKSICSSDFPDGPNGQVKVFCY